MTFNYFPTIPNPPNDPADDVALMQTNSASINSIVAVDHVGFNAVGGGGQHKKVTFNSNSVPAVFPVSPPVLFTDTVAGLPQLKFYSGDAAHSSNQYVLAGTGSTFLMGGIILKWGTFTMGAGVTTQAVTFAGAFPNGKLSVVVSATSGQAADVISAQVDANLTNFTAARAITSNLPYYYIAIGY